MGSASECRDHNASASSYLGYDNLRNSVPVGLRDADRDDRRRNSEAYP